MDCKEDRLLDRRDPSRVALANGYADVRTFAVAGADGRGLAMVCIDDA